MTHVQAEEIVQYIKEALIASVDANTFMDEQTKAKAKAKVRVWSQRSIRCLALLDTSLIAMQRYTYTGSQYKQDVNTIYVTVCAFK